MNKPPVAKQCHDRFNAENPGSTPGLGSTWRLISQVGRVDRIRGFQFRRLSIQVECHFQDRHMKCIII